MHCIRVRWFLLFFFHINVSFFHSSVGWNASSNSQFECVLKKETLIMEDLHWSKNSIYSIFPFPFPFPFSFPFPLPFLSLSFHQFTVRMHFNQETFCCSAGCRGLLSLFLLLELQRLFSMPRLEILPPPWSVLQSCSSSGIFCSLLSCHHLTLLPTPGAEAARRLATTVQVAQRMAIFAAARPMIAVERAAPMLRWSPPHFSQERLRKRNKINSNNMKPNNYLWNAMTHPYQQAIPSRVTLLRAVCIICIGREI